jgi:Xaa-Pro aminopeptidase
MERDLQITRLRKLAPLVLILLLCALVAPARQREPNSVYSDRRGRLLAQVDGPIVLFGYTGREQASPSYIFNQEENFHYLTGHNEPGAALLLLPAGANNGSQPREILFLPPRSDRERWDGPRLVPGDANLAERTGFAEVKPFTELKGELERAAKSFANFHTLLPAPNQAGYPHARNWQNWLRETVPQATVKNVRAQIGAMRQVKSPSEIELIVRATEISIDSHLEAMRMLRPGIWEYEVAARMEYLHKRSGCEGEAYAPIVGSGFFSTVLHYNDVNRRIEDGDVIVIDVGAQCAGYAADITRTLPASGKFTPRQREIYEIVLGAQNAALAAVKPGATFARSGPNSLYKLSYDYIDSHGKDMQGRSLGRYFIHGLGHHIGLQVHDAGDPVRPLEPGMIVTIEPGIYIPEENLGVRIEDIVLVTETGYKLLTARLPRTLEEVEKFMADARKQRREE